MRSAGTARRPNGSTNDTVAIYDSRTLDPYAISSEYFFTIKHTSRYPTLNHYKRILDKWSRHKDFHPQCVTYELDSIGKLHVHGIAKARPKYLVQRLHLKKYAIDVQEILSDREWNQVYSYCFKEHQNTNEYLQDIFLSEYEIRTSKYPFIAGNSLKNI